MVGTGSAGMRHLAALRSLDYVLPIAVPKRRPRLIQLKEAGYCTADCLEDAARQGVSMCVVASDSSSHLEDCLLAQNLGLHVLVEKPLATSTAEARQLTELAHTIDRHLFVGCTLRFSRSLGRFRELLHQLGELHSVRIACQSFLPDWRPNRPYRDSYSARAGEGGVLLDLIHEIDYSGWIFGWPTKVTGQVKNFGTLEIDSEEMAEMTWETPAGCIVSTGLDYLSRVPFRRMRASGSEGTMEWDGILGTVTLMLTGSPVQSFESRQDVDSKFADQAKAFVESCMTSVDPRLATGEEGVKSLAVCEAVRRSSASGNVEDVGQLREAK